jgi:ABC-type sugar transport system substrate-binding protein
MIVDYINAHLDTIDRNGDGIIGYVLAIGDIGHNDSIARTRGIRQALGTGVAVDGEIDPSPAETNVDGSSSVVQDGEIGGLTVRELASHEMKNPSGATWDAAAAESTIGIWTSSFGDQIDMIVSNNDGMGMAMFHAWSKEESVPTFGYDANSDAVAAIAEGYAGTISQHADVQAYLTLRVLRNALLCRRNRLLYPVWRRRLRLLHCRSVLRLGFGNRFRRSLCFGKICCLTSRFCRLCGDRRFRCFGCVLRYSGFRGFGYRVSGIKFRFFIPIIHDFDRPYGLVYYLLCRAYGALLRDGQ